jgi:L-iditol 2-dehydrogenase
VKAVVVREPHRAGLLDQPRPYPRPGEILVRVAIAGLGHRDLDLLDGTSPATMGCYPVVAGHEWCGTVAEVGAGVQGVKVGQRVVVEAFHFCGTCFWCRQGETNLCETARECGFTRPGGFADYATARADLAHPLSDSLSFATAVLAEPAAHVAQALLRAKLGAGTTVAVVGMGTLGLLGIAWATRFGPGRILAIDVDHTGDDLAHMMGATEYLLLDEDLPARVEMLTLGRGVDVVFLTGVDRGMLPLALAIGRQAGTIIIGQLPAGPPVRVDADIFRRRELRVHSVAGYTSGTFMRALRLIEDGWLDVRPLITHRFPLTAFARAFDVLRSRGEPVGKILLEP